ncbi:Na/Pi cotransporter family protein [Microvirga sp. 3-52]|jgi:phosphate:Na+ symporter|uniref:Na/Pi cotransporter family protein n=1 Tax=Microvirga sp. 3-52 TaxID=2792425 RepID=UPI001AD5CC74|nr:Na/Pi cotransporter family protein [Microvirga sp. 3-52]MBO1904838.1 Na/Pi cotransporter family protein [Microvirga sp. 3-52]MBS7452370.1 Na/Pi cotransporter family protein [Microvirga sp. 3-52]
MSATSVLIHLFGEIALLLWGINMVNSGVQRAFGSDLRWILGVALRTRLQAFLAGVGVTTVLQSSTATALMVASFTAGGAVDIVPALAVMLGANVGTTLIVQVLSFDVSLIFPALIFGGFVAYRRGRTSRIKDLGRVTIGLGLMLLSLHLLSETIRPIESSKVIKDLLAVIAPDPLIMVLLSAIFAWLAHSSVAALLFIMSLAGAGVIDAHSALVMVLGANLGSSLNPLLEGTSGDPVKLRVPFGNFAMRVIGCLVALPLIDPILSAMSIFDPHPERLAANFHTLFNVMVAAIFILPLPWIAQFLLKFFPEKLRSSDPGAPQYLDKDALDTPSVALSNAAREVLRMVDTVESMLRSSQDLFREDDISRVDQVSRTDDVLDRLFSAIRRYLSSINHESLSEGEAKRLSDILAFAINLEHVGDIIDKNLMELAAKRIKNHLRLPKDSLEDITSMHAKLLEHLQLAASVLMFQDLGSARRLVSEKERFRDLERAVAQKHLDQLRSGRAAGDTSTLQLDIVRDLKRIEAHIASTGHSLLEQSGELKPSRLTS